MKEFTEKWKDVQNYEGMYQVSDQGRIKSLTRFAGGVMPKILIEKIKTQRADSDGYRLVNLCSDGKKRTFKVHRLVANAFINNPENLPEINHDDGDKANNSVKNLAWVTGSVNKTHAWETGLRKSRKGSKNKGYVHSGKYCKSKAA